VDEGVVETKYGNISGAFGNGCWAWKGVPFARPPVGPLRFRPPQPPVPWDGVYQATSYSPAAMQLEDVIMSKLGNALTNLDEDCLYLNVWSQAADNQKRPVIVWIHGGAFKQGSGVDPWFDGTSFAVNGDVVLVTVNYRLSVLGFLYLEELTANQDFVGSGNCGLLDQVAALEWVRDNIEAFGGDPNRVTIAGQSAGAQSVAALMAMPGARGLFHQAILQSGQAGVNFATREKATAKARELLRLLGISEHDLDRLQSIPAEELLRAAASSNVTAGSTPVVDGTSLPEYPLDALHNGGYDGIKLLVGYALDEFKLFIFEDESWGELDTPGIIQRFEARSGAVPNFAVEYYLNRNPGHEPLESLMPLQSFRQFGLQTLKIAEVHTRRGGAVFVYRFDWRSTAQEGRLGACHSQDLPFVFNTLYAPGVTNFTGDSPERESVAMQVHRSWIAFAHSGDPNGKHIASWPKYDLVNRPTMLLNVTSKVQNDPAKAERELWEGILGTV
jgi:para-nitrobenzyl esterase